MAKTSLALILLVASLLGIATAIYLNHAMPDALVGMEPILLIILFALSGLGFAGVGLVLWKSQSYTIGK